MRKTVELNGQLVEYELERKKVKNFNLRIRPDGSIRLSVPMRTPEYRVTEFLRSRSDFIQRGRERMLRQRRERPAKPEYADGDTLEVLGKPLRIQLQKDGRNYGENVGSVLCLHLREPEDAALRRKTAEAWLRSCCARAVEEKCEALFPSYGIPRPTVRLRKMKTQWGNCRPRTGVMTFNTALIRTPEECVEYVVAHELTHFLHPDHSKDFYAALAQRMPDHRARKKRLREYGYLLEE